MAPGKTLQSTIEISGVLSPSLQSVINKAVDKLEEMSKETLENAGAAAKLAAEMGAQESVLKSLKRGYADYVVSGRESSEEAQTLASKIEELSEELVQNEKTLREAEKAADAYDKSLEEAGESAKDSSEGYTILKDVISDLATQAIDKAVESFKELVIAGDAALGMLSAKTGATADELEGFEDVMYEVYNANYGESLGDVSDKLSTVIQLTDDLDNASLAKVTKSAIALEDVFGFDTEESLRTANSLMDQFGITSEEAFNLIVQGAQNGLNQNGDLLDTINEYAVQFKGAGYTAENMFNMLANGAETGTWSVDKLGDAVKEFNIRMSDDTASEYLDQLGVDTKKVMKQFNKGGPEAQKAISTIMKAIEDCDDATLQYQVGVGLFGTMWEDLGAETVASLMNTQGAISGTADAMARLDEAAYGTLESSLSKLGRTIEAEAVQPIVEKLTPALKEGVDFLTVHVGPTVDWFLNNLPTLAIVIGGVAAAMVAFNWGAIVGGITGAASAMKAFGAVLAANPIGLVIIAITALVAAFVYLWDNCEAFRNFWINLWDGITGKVGTAADWIGDKINSAKNAVSTAAAAMKNAFNFNWSLPKPKLPHFSIDGKFSLNPPSVPKLAIDWYADGGILTKPTIFGAAGNTLLAGGEAGAEAVVPLATLWDKLETMIRAVFNSASSTGGTSGAGLTSKAGELLTLDDFSLGSLADGTNVVIYYDFSNFTWSPQIQTGGTGDNEDDLMARLRAHEAEFFDWLEEFIHMREVAQYA